MAWDRNELVILGMSLILITILAGLKIMDKEFVQMQFSVVIGYAAGRIFNHIQGKE